MFLENVSEISVCPSVVYLFPGVVWRSCVVSAMFLTPTGAALVTGHGPWISPPFFVLLCLSVHADASIRPPLCVAVFFFASLFFFSLFLFIRSALRWTQVPLVGQPSPLPSRESSPTLQAPV
eukprot:RCo043963